MSFDPEVFAASWSPSGEPLTKTVPASLAVIFWAFLGVESAAVLSQRVKDPAHDVGRASIAGVSLAAVIYIAASAAVFGVIPAAVLAQSTSPYADLIARVFGASVAGVAAACAVVKATGTLGGWVMMAGETARAGAEHGYLPKGFGQGGRATRATPLLGGAIMSIAAVLSSQQTLGGQFGLLIGVTSVLTLSVYAVCCVSLLRTARTRRDKTVAVIGLIFSVAAVAAAAPGYILPTLGFVAMVSGAWFLWLRRPSVDPTQA